MKLLSGFLLMLFGVLTQNTEYNVIYPRKPICAVRGFSVSLPCSYSYPRNVQVVRKLWCSMNSNTERCINTPHVYDSTSHTESDFEFVGDDDSDCTLLIHDVKFSYSGEYKFRFITGVKTESYTGDPGVTLLVTDLKMSLIRLGGNGTFKPGDSLNLKCDVNCTHTSSQFVWSKNNELLNTSGPVLHFPALTARDSGNYTCTWKTKKSSGSKSIRLPVDGDNTENPKSTKTTENWQIWVIISATVGVSVIVAFILGAVIYKRRCVDDGRSVQPEQQKQKDDSVIFSNRQANMGDFSIYTNV